MPSSDKAICFFQNRIRQYRHCSRTITRLLIQIFRRLLDEVSFDAAHLTGQTVCIDAAYVDERLQALSQDDDLSRFIL